MKRPEFTEIKTYDEFEKYYWYKDELKEICKSLGTDHTGNKKELEEVIKAYFNGIIIPRRKRTTGKVRETKIRLDTPLLECGFTLNGRFREFFSEVTGKKNFKFTADMAAALKKVRETDDIHFSIGDLLDVYYGRSDYASYDNSSCQWNRFYSDFCKDDKSQGCKNKMKAASILWKIVRESTGEKRYDPELLQEHFEQISEYYECFEDKDGTD